MHARAAGGRAADKAGELAEGAKGAVRDAADEAASTAKATGAVADGRPGLQCARARRSAACRTSA